MLPKFNCRQCGEKLSIFEFGPEKICPHCGKETAPVNIKEVHVNFGDTIYADVAVLPRKSSNRFVLGVDYINVFFRLELCMGDISSPPYSNGFSYAHHYSSWEQMESYVEDNVQKLSLVDKNAIVYLWLNERDVNGYLNLLKFSYLFRRFKEVYLIRCCSENDMQNDEYEPNDSFLNRKRITRDELLAMKKKYSEIVKLDGWYRIGRYGEVRTCDEKLLEKYVMSEITNEFQSFNSIFVKASEAFKEKTGYVFHYDVFEEIVLNMMREKKIKSQWGYAFWNNSPGRKDLLIDQDLCLNRPKAISYTYDDALQIVCDAFKYGYTCPLFDILDNNAILSLVDYERSFGGKYAIIEFVENEGSWHANVNKENVSCNILRIAERGRQAIKDPCILLCYEQKDGKKNYYILKVRFENNKIVKIQIIEW